MRPSLSSSLFLHTHTHTHTRVCAVLMPLASGGKACMPTKVLKSMESHDLAPVEYFSALWNDSLFVHTTLPERLYLCHYGRRKSAQRLRVLELLTPAPRWDPWDLSQAPPTPRSAAQFPDDLGKAIASLQTSVFSSAK